MRGELPVLFECSHRHRNATVTAVPVGLDDAWSHGLSLSVPARLAVREVSTDGGVWAGDVWRSSSVQAATSGDGDLGPRSRLERRGLAVGWHSALMARRATECGAMHFGPDMGPDLRLCLLPNTALLRLGTKCCDFRFFAREQLSVFAPRYISARGTAHRTL